MLLKTRLFFKQHGTKPIFAPLRRVVSFLGRFLERTFDHQPHALLELKAEHAFRLQFEKSTLPMLLIDKNARILSINTAATRLYNSTEEDLAGQFLADFCVNPEDVRKIEEVSDGFLVLRQQPKQQPSRLLEFAVSQFFIQKRPVRQLILRDVSERETVLSELRASRKQFQQIVDFLPDATVAIDMRGHVILWNKSIERMTRISADDMLGYAMYRYAIPFHGEQRKILIDFVLDAAAGLDSPEAHYPGVTRNGLTLSAEVFCSALYETGAWVLTIAAPLFGADGEQIGAIECIRDISDRKKADLEKLDLERQLHHAQKMEAIGNLAGGVAHDFNNLLSVIMLSADMALRKLEDGQPVKDELKNIQGTAAKSASITKQLLAFARRQPVSPKSIELNNAINGNLEMLRRLIGEQIQINWVPSETSWKLRIDPSQIDQILFNLCVNSRDAMNGAGVIWISTAAVDLQEPSALPIQEMPFGEYMQISITDTGHGIPEEHLNHVFEPFFTTKEVGKGTGLGLATVYGIVRQNNGFIHVESSTGTGTTFRIYLPKQRQLHEKERLAKLQARNLTGSETLLVVEDDRMILKMVSEMLRSFGYTIFAASSPTEALLQYADSTPPIDMLLSDVIMPDMNGVELFQKISSSRPDMRCLFMSGYSAELISAQCILEETVAFISKPFTQAMLAEKIRDVLDSTQ